MVDPPPLPLSAMKKADTVSAKESKSQAHGRIFPCLKCGADVEFHIGTQQMKCPYCGHEEKLSVDTDDEIQEHNYGEELQRLRELHEDDAELNSLSGMQEVHCDACNGMVVFENSQTSKHCPYCSSPIQLDQIHELKTRISPDGVIPFQITHKQAKNLLGKWVSSRWFAPNSFKKQGIQGKFNGVYFPYWTYDSFTANSYRGQRGDEYTVTVGTGKNRRRVTRVRWTSVSGSFQRFFDDVLVIASPGLVPKLIRGVEPWPLDEAIPFTREAFAGFLARTYEIELDTGFDQAKVRINEVIRRDVRRRIGGDRQRIGNINTQHSAITFKYMFLPIWLLSYRHNDKVFQIICNAATGKISGQRPYSWLKIAGAVLLAGAAVCGLIYFMGGMNSSSMHSSPNFRHFDHQSLPGSFDFDINF